MVVLLLAVVVLLLLMVEVMMLLLVLVMTALLKVCKSLSQMIMHSLNFMGNEFQTQRVIKIYYLSRKIKFQS